MLKILVIYGVRCYMNVKYLFFIFKYNVGNQYCMCGYVGLFKSCCCSFCSVKVAFLAVVAHLLYF